VAKGIVAEATREECGRASNNKDPMTANAFHNPFHAISQIESSLWEAADQLRANSRLTSSEYCMPVLGVIFLRHASNRCEAALQAIKTDQAAGKP
jgi:type I restriction enzyme M protein